MPRAGKDCQFTTQGRKWIENWGMVEMAVWLRGGVVEWLVAGVFISVIRLT
jgi:hypothetical protein